MNPEFTYSNRKRGENVIDQHRNNRAQSMKAMLLLEGYDGGTDIHKGFENSEE